ncbi:MAG: hypothetical protein ABL901_21490 [Hyphomicrobiaceae bacterium]
MFERHRTTTPLAPPLHAGDVRRFGPDGVLYEILKVPVSGDKALIRVLDTDEELAYAISKVLADPTD